MLQRNAMRRIRKLLAGRIDRVGALPCLDFLDLAEFAEFLAPYRIVVVEGEDGRWVK